MLGQKRIPEKFNADRSVSYSAIFHGFLASLALTIFFSPPLFAFDLPPLDSGNGLIIAGEPVSGQLGGQGNTMSGIGDINGDGIDDFALSALFIDSITNQAPTKDHGRVYVVFGRGSANPYPANFNIAELMTGDANGNAIQGFALTGTQGSLTGSSISGNCDINGDGNPDLVVGAPRTVVQRSVPLEQVAQAGEVYVIYGRNSDQPFKADISVASLRDGSGSLGMFIKGARLRNEAGKSVVCVKSINGDLFDDVFIGTGISDAAATGKALEQGRAYVMYGAADLPPEFDVLDLESASADGTTGFVINATTFTSVTVIKGDPTADPIIPDVIVTKTLPDDFSKYSANAGDMNGDGVNDLVIAAPSASPTGSTTENGKLNSGQTYVIFGRPGNFPAILNIADLLGGNGSIGFAINGMRVKDQIGQAIGSAGDINGDGTADIVIGAHAVNLDSNAGGQSYIVLGRNTSISGPFPAILELTDVQSGDGSTGIIIDGTTGSSGFSVAGLGDFNSDGLDDVAIGAPYHNSEGAVYVLLGRDKTRPLPAIISLAEFEDDINDYGFIIHGAERDQKSGSAIANAGDINNDLIPDLLIGAPDANTSSILKIKPGEVFAIYGGVDIAQREIRPEAHKGGVPNRTPDPDTRRPQTAVGHAWWLLLILFLAKTYPRWRSARRD